MGSKSNGCMSKLPIKKRFKQGGEDFGLEEGLLCSLLMPFMWLVFDSNCGKGCFCVERLHSLLCAHVYVFNLFAIWRLLPKVIKYLKYCFCENN